MGVLDLSAKFDSLRWVQGLQGRCSDRGTRRRRARLHLSEGITEAHKRQYLNEWKRFEDSQTKVWHDVRLSPGCTPAVTATLEELGIRTLEGLAAYDKPLPEFIEKHRAFAKRFLSFLKPRFKIVDGKPVEVAA